jgi:hypothetical protein
VGFWERLAREFLDPTDWTNWVMFGSFALMIWLLYR